MTQREIIEILSGFVGTIGFAVLFNIRGRRLVAAALGGFLSWALFVLLSHLLESEAVNYFLVAFLISVYAEIMARVLKTPTTVFVTTSLIPLIPGGSLYYTMAYAFESNREKFLERGLYTLQLAAALALGIIAATALTGILCKAAERAHIQKSIRRKSVKHRTYIFDFDGTLVDSMPCWSEKVLNVLRKNGISYPDDILKVLTPLGDAGTMRYYKEVFGVTMSEAEMTAIMDEYALPRYRDEIVLKEGVEDYLRRMKAAGCSLNVLTASPHKMLDPCLSRNGIAALFDNIWSCDDFGTTKADVRIYTDAIARIGSTVEDTVFFDDNIGAVSTAKRAGLYTVGVHDASGESFTEELKATADRYITTFADLEQI